MKKIIALGVMFILAMLLISGCIPKELRTVKIEMGPVATPRQTPDIDRVKRNLEMAQKAYPNNAEVYQYWGRVYALENKYQEMAQALAKSDSLDTKGVLKKDNDTIRQNKWKDLFDKGKAFANKDEFDKALDAFKSSGICWPERYESWINAAVMAQQLNDTLAAFDYSSKAYKIAPETTAVYENHARICLFAKKYGDAKQIYEKMLAKSPTDTDVIFAIGEICATLNDTVKAIEYYNRGLEIKKDDPNSWWNAGLLYSKIKNYCKAADCFKEVTALSPEDKDAKCNYLKAAFSCAVQDTTKINAAATKTKLEAVKVEALKLTAAYPDNSDGWSVLYQTYMKLGIQKEAEAAFKTWTDLQKNKK